MSEIENVDGAIVEDVEILDAAKIKAAMSGGPVFVSIIDRYAPKGMETTVFEVTKVLPRNVDLKPIDGDRLIRIDPFCVAYASDAEVAAARERAAGRPALHLGSVVTVKAGTGAMNPASVFVVTALTAGDTVSLAKLGGTENRYWPKVPVSRIAQVIDVTAVGAALAKDPRLTA